MPRLFIFLAVMLLPFSPALADDTGLKGLTAAALEDLLGTPSLLRPEPPAQLWQYADEKCVLQVYLYDPPAGGDAVVEHVEARMRGADQPPMAVDQVPACLDARGVASPAQPDAAE